MTRAASIKHSNWLQFHVGCNAIRARSRLDVIPYGQSNHRTDKLMVSAKHALTMLLRNGLVMTGVIQKCLPKTIARGESTIEAPSTLSKQIWKLQVARKECSYSHNWTIRYHAWMLLNMRKMRKNSNFTFGCKWSALWSGNQQKTRKDLNRSTCNNLLAVSWRVATVCLMRKKDGVHKKFIWWK